MRLKDILNEVIFLFDGVCQQRFPMPDVQYSIVDNRMCKMFFGSFFNLEFTDQFHFCPGWFNQRYIAIVRVAVQMVISKNNTAT